MKYLLLEHIHPAYRPYFIEYTKLSGYKIEECWAYKSRTISFDRKATISQKIAILENTNLNAVKSNIYETDIDLDYARVEEPSDNSSIVFDRAILLDKKKQVTINSEYFCYNETNINYNIPDNNLYLLRLEGFVLIALSGFAISSYDMCNINTLFDTLNNITIYSDKFNVNKKYIIFAKFVEGVNFGENKQFIAINEETKIISVDNVVFCCSSNPYNSLDDLKAFFDDVSITNEEFSLKLKNTFINNNKKEIENLEEKIQHREKELLQLYDSLGKKKTLEKFTTKQCNSMLDSFVGRIQSNTDIKEFKFIQKGFFFRTKEIFTEFQNKTYYIGVFEVKCYLFEEIAITFANVESPNKRWNHPHNACLGTYKTAIKSCLIEMDYFTLVLTILSMLKSLNEEDAAAVNRLTTNFSFEEKPQDTYKLKSINILI